MLGGPHVHEYARRKWSKMQRIVIEAASRSPIWRKFRVRGKSGRLAAAGVGDPLTRDRKRVYPAIQRHLRLCRLWAH